MCQLSVWVLEEVYRGVQGRIYYSQLVHKLQKNVCLKDSSFLTNVTVSLQWSRYIEYAF